MFTLYSLAECTPMPYAVNIPHYRVLDVYNIPSLVRGVTLWQPCKSRRSAIMVSQNIDISILVVKR